MCFFSYCANSLRESKGFLDNTDYHVSMCAYIIVPKKITGKQLNNRRTSKT